MMKLGKQEQNLPGGVKYQFMQETAVLFTAFLLLDLHIGKPQLKSETRLSVAKVEVVRPKLA